MQIELPPKNLSVTVKQLRKLKLKRKFWYELSEFMHSFQNPNSFIFQKSLLFKLFLFYFQSNLPVEYAYKILSAEVLCDKYEHLVTTFRVGAKTPNGAVKPEAVKEWVDKWKNDFEVASNTNFRIKRTWNVKSSSRVSFKVCFSNYLQQFVCYDCFLTLCKLSFTPNFQKKYRCHHNTLAEKSGIKLAHEKHTKCPAEMTITFKNQDMKW
jgi:hypothetical protein